MVPTIMEKWLASSSSEPIFVQQDNPKSHISVDDIDRGGSRILNLLGLELKKNSTNSKK